MSLNDAERIISEITDQIQLKCPFCRGGASIAFKHEKVLAVFHTMPFCKDFWNMTPEEYSEKVRKLLNS